MGGEVLSSPAGVVPPERRRMGMVFQNYAVWPHMSVLENVAFGLRYAQFDRRDEKSRVDQILAAVGLEGLEDRHPGQLSGGQQQRVALARSLVVEPSILLLDEPLSNLDAKLRERMRSELKSLQRRTGITFIYVTHDQAEAMALSDRIAVFHRGTVQQVGSPRDVYERPANLFVADFMGLVNKVPATIVSRDGDTAVVTAGEHRLTVAASGNVTGTIRRRRHPAGSDPLRGRRGRRRSDKPAEGRGQRGHVPRQHRRLPDRYRRRRGAAGSRATGGISARPAAR